MIGVANLTIDRIIQADLRIGHLIKSAKSNRGRNKSRCYEAYKSRIISLVGACADKDELRTYAAYEITIRAIANALNL